MVSRRLERALLWSALQTSQGGAGVVPQNWDSDSGQDVNHVEQGKDEMTWKEPKEGQEAVEMLRSGERPQAKQKAPPFWTGCERASERASLCAGHPGTSAHHHEGTQGPKILSSFALTPRWKPWGLGRAQAHATS